MIDSLMKFLNRTCRCSSDLGLLEQSTLISPNLPWLSLLRLGVRKCNPGSGCAIPLPESLPLCAIQFVCFHQRAGICTGSAEHGVDAAAGSNLSLEFYLADGYSVLTSLG